MPDLLKRLQKALRDRYSVERELGQGGMAAVFLGEDRRHHRKVAIKVLRPEIAATLGAGRFAREIEVAARLQHPNILPLHDSGEADGFFFYVMPYVEGQSLRDRLVKGGELPIQEVVRIMSEVADALSHAHARGVVHRDIKPDNVMLLGRHAVVTDFGVAKAVTEATGHQMLTSTGVALGTPAYMAPEQASADPHQDHRVDIYALGVLGYELLTGRAPFPATTAQEMLAAHLTAEPEPLEMYRPAVPLALAEIVMRCLAKKPADRWQTAEELLQHLEPLMTPTGGVTPARTTPAAPAGRLPRWATWTSGLAALAIVVFVATRFLAPRPLAVTASDITQVTSDPGVEFQPAISPNGSDVAYVAGPIGAPRLYVRSTGGANGGAAIRLGATASGGQWLPSWSPDGQAVRFQSCTSDLPSQCALMESARLGGAVRPVTLPNGGSPTFSPDGRRVAFVVGDTIFTASPSDPVPHRVALATQNPREVHSLAWSPDGRWIAYVNGNALWRASANVSGSAIWVVAARGGEPRRVTGDDHLNVSPVWLDVRHLLFVSDRDGQRAVYVVEVGAGGARGEPQAIAGLSDPHTISYSAVSRRLAYAKLTLRQNIWSYPLGRSAPISIREGRPVTTGTQVVETHDVSRDGRWIAYSANLRGHMDLFKVAVTGGEPVPLDAGPSGGEAPRWSPGGNEIAFHTTGLSEADVMVVPAAGGSPSVASVRGAWPVWGATDNQLFFASPDSTGHFVTAAVVRDSVGARWRREAQVGLVGLIDAAPDGRGLLCRTRWTVLEGRDLEGRLVWRRDLTAAGGLVPDGSRPRLAPDAHTVYVAGSRGGRTGVWAVPVPTGAPRLIVAFDDPALVPYGWLSVGPDRLYVTVSQYESDIWAATLHY